MGGGGRDGGSGRGWQMESLMAEDQHAMRVMERMLEGLRSEPPPTDRPTKCRPLQAQSKRLSDWRWLVLMPVELVVGVLRGGSGTRGDDGVFGAFGVFAVFDVFGVFQVLEVLEVLEVLKAFEAFSAFVVFYVCGICRVRGV